jgi:hypothetical protein
VTVPDTVFFSDVVRRHVDGLRFVRRDWLAREVTDRVDDPACRMLLLTGEPGAGKSAFIAQLAADDPACLTYFIRRDQRSPLASSSARAVLLRLGFQFAALYPDLFAPDQVRVVVEQRIGTVEHGGAAVAAEVGRILASPFHRTVVQVLQDVDRAEGDVTGLRVGQWVDDPALLEVDDLAAMALLDPARALYARAPQDRVVVLIDALDELSRNPDEQSLLTWLAGVDLPQNVTVVLTSRPEPLLKGLIDRLGERLTRLEIDGSDPRVRRDLRDFTRRLTGEPMIAAALAAVGREPDAFGADLVEKADGNIGYLDALARALEVRADDNTGETLAALLALEQLPADLEELYAFFLTQLRTGPGARLVRLDDEATGLSGRAEAWTELYWPMLELLCVAFEPLTAQQLTLLSGTVATPVDALAAVQRLRPFLDQDDNGGYRLYHTTFGEFLIRAEGEVPASPEPSVDPVSVHRRLAARLNPQRWLDALDGPPVQAVRDYGRRHRLEHLYDGGAWDELFATLDDVGHAREQFAADPSAYQLWLDLGLGVQAAARDVDELTAVELLPRLWRYSVSRLALSQTAGEHSVEALASYALLGRPEQALRLTTLIAAPAERFKVSLRLATLLVTNNRHTEDEQETIDALGLELVRLAGMAISELSNAESLVGELLGTVAVLFKSGMPLEEDDLAALEGLARTLTDPVQRAGAYGDLIRVLASADRLMAAQGLLDETFDLAREVETQAEHDDVLVLLAETCADSGAHELAGMILPDISGLEACLRALTSLAPHAHAPELWPQLLVWAERAEEFLGGPLVDAGEAGTRGRCIGMSRVALACHHLGDDERAQRCRRAALEAYVSLADPDPATTEDLLGALPAEPHHRTEPTLRTVAIRHATQTALTAIGRRKPREGLAFDVAGAQTVIVLAAAGEPDAALQVAAAVPPAERAGAHVHVIAALARTGRRAEAADIISWLEHEAHRSFLDFGVDPLLASGSPADRGRHALAVALASTGELEPALEAAHSIGNAPTRCAALAAVALALADEDLDAATTILAEHDRDLRLTSAKSGQLDAARTALHLLIDTRNWQAALGLLPRTWAQHEAADLAEALLAADERELARSLIDELDPYLRARLLVAWARDAPVQQLEAALQEAEQAGRQIADLADQVSALDSLIRHRIEHQPAEAAALVRRTIRLLNPIRPLPVWPGPWSAIPEYLALLGDVDASFDLAGRLPPDEAAVAFCRVARALAVAEAPVEPSRALEVAESCARNIDSPDRRTSAQARIAAESTRLGIVNLPSAQRADPKVKRAVAAELARTGHANQAAQLLGEDQGGASDEDRIELVVVTGLLDAGDRAPALRLARTIKSIGPRAIALCLWARATAAADEDYRPALEEAVTLLPQLHRAHLDAIAAIGQALAEAGPRSKLLEIARPELANARDLDLLGTRLGLLTPLLRDHPQLVAEVASSFAQVDQFLSSLA